ncbi:sterol desaturase family protein [Roseivirga sp. E12]|uniref:sterol desaturase family protein n=1 Tax=Roseivirga sp. E12 TaxID=2819237 RepID=UPI001ABC7A4C|nr:sterol desaturase family protein [Roseivirga sp. E12]MBO3698634.1 sterol desaturase family protein [Roseivirga sp. E12]
MESLVSFFDNVPTEFRAGILISGILFFWILEGTVPLIRFSYKKWRHAGINLFLTLTTMIIGFGLAGALLFASDLVAQNRFGLLYIIDLPLWGQLIVGVLLMDLIGAYFIHWTEHKVKWMWKFHLVHHSDTTVDVTTGLRHHPGETVFRIGFTILAVMVIGAPMWIIMVYQSLSVLFAHITHANINMPKAVDRALSWVFITPLMHKVHHHYMQPLTDTNYGNIFSFWDRIFGTFAQVEDTTELVYGIDTHMDPKENDQMGSLLKIPFEPYRPPTGSKFGD